MAEIDLAENRAASATEAWYFSGRTLWALGFMSGLNTSRLASGWVTKNMASMSVEELEIAIAKYCNDHPLGSFNQAVMDVYFSLQNSDYQSSRTPAVTTPASQQ